MTKYKHLQILVTRLDGTTTTYIFNSGSPYISCISGTSHKYLDSTGNILDSGKLHQIQEYKESVPSGTQMYTADEKSDAEPTSPPAFVPSCYWAYVDPKSGKTMKWQCILGPSADPKPYHPQCGSVIGPSGEKEWCSYAQDFSHCKAIYWRDSLSSNYYQCVWNRTPPPTPTYL